VAFELARHFRRSGAALPGHLFVSGRQAPHLPDPVPRIPDLSDEQFIRELQRCYGGVPDAIARDPQIRSVFLPTIRADLELVYTYVHEPGPPLPCGISVFGGTQDNLSRADLEGWQSHTAGEFRLHLLEGDHFFVTSQTEAVLQRTAEDLRHAFPALVSRSDGAGAGC
jgi:surfactin synthase thioesterase subunit